MIDTLLPILAALAVFAGAVERVTEMVKKFLAAKFPALFGSETTEAPELREAMVILLSFLVSFAGVFLISFDPLSTLLPSTPAVQRMVLTALVAPFGSAFFNAAIDWVRAFGSLKSAS